jgi:hypothetical protein
MADKVLIVWSQETANNYFSATAYADLFMAAQHQAEAAGVPYDIVTADNLATMTAAQLSQYSAIVAPSMAYVQSQAQATTLTTLLSQAEALGVGIITSGNFMTNAIPGAVALTTPYLAMSTLLGVLPVTSGTGTYSVTVAPGATSNPIMAGYTPTTLIGGASGQFAGTTAGYYTATGYQSFAANAGVTSTTLANINLEATAGGATTSSLAGVVQTTTGGAVNTVFGTDGLFGDSNLLQHVIQNAAFGSGPSLTLDTTRFAGIFNSRTDMDQSQFATDVKPASGSGIYDAMMPILQQWQQQYGFVGSFYTNVGNGTAAAGNAGNGLTLTAPYLKQLLQMGSEVGSHSMDHLITPPTTTPVTPAEDTNYLSATQPANLTTPSFTYAYEFGQSNTLINQALGITVAGAAVPGANDTSATALNILQYYPSTSVLTGYVNGGWTGVGSGSPNAFGYINPSNTSSVYIAPNITFDFTEIGFNKKTPTQALADWESLFNQLSANSQQPIIVWPWHDYGLTNWNNAGAYTTQMFTDFVAYAYSKGYEFVTTEDLAARVAAEQRAVLTETKTATTINVTVTPGVATDDLGKMALNVTNGGANVIKNAGSWYAYDSKSVFVAKGGVSNVTVTLGATQDDVTHIDALPMRADLQTVTGNGSNLSFSMTGDGVADIHVKTPGANVVSVQGAPAAKLTGTDLSLTFNDGALAISSTSPQGVPVLHTVTVSDQATAVSSSGNDFIFGGTGNDTITGGGGNDYINGGGGTNTAVFSGLESNYKFTLNADGSVTSVDTRAGSPDGTDTNVNIQDYKFSDGSVFTQAQLFSSTTTPINIDPVKTVHINDIAYSGNVTGPYNFIDLPNLEASYGDLIQAFGTNTPAMQNWLASYQPIEHRPDTFDGLDYIASYGDLINAFKSAGSEQAALDAGASHFITYGSAEGRTTTFNSLDYIASYGDLIKAFGANGDAGAYHYIEYGASEGRTTSFDGLDYIASYSDLIKAFGANEQAGAAHFIANGSAEGRTTTFDGLDYIAGYTDLMTAFGANNDAGASHFITNGLTEGRQAHAFDVGAYETAHPDLIGKYASNDVFLTAYINTYATTGKFLT